MSKNFQSPQRGRRCAFEAIVTDTTAQREALSAIQGPKNLRPLEAFADVGAFGHLQFTFGNCQSDR